LGRRGTGLRRDTDRRQVETGKVEQLFGQSPHPGRLVEKRVAQRESLSFGQLALSLVQRDGNAVDARQRVPELVRRERDELALQNIELPHLLTGESVFEQGCSENTDGRERLLIYLGR
jgi:hypothetical protein